MAESQNNTQQNGTAKNTLKQWFVTGAKPLAAQYWAWMDSYWHKSESISITAIANLAAILASKADADQLDHKADKDAANIDPQLWKQKLGVGELPLNIATIDYVFPNGEEMAGNAYKKVDNPGDGKTYLLKIDGTAVDADTFGKNLGNSNLTQSAENRTYNQNGKTLTFTGGTFNVQGETDFHNTTQKFSGVTDKSADVTYNFLMGLNANGFAAKVDGKTIFNNIPALLTDQEKTNWKTAMNGGWTTNTMSVALINPIVVQKIDVIQYVTLLGANLNMNPASFTVEIVDTSGVNVVALIPNSQVQLQTNGLSLIFYYNFKNLPIGSYKIRLWNGVAYYTSSISFQVLNASQIYPVDKSQISWTFDFITKSTGGSYTDYSESFGSILLGSKVLTNTGVPYIGNNNVDIASALSSSLMVDGSPLTYNDNFYLELEFTSNHNASGHIGGISYENNVSMISNFSHATVYYYETKWKMLPQNLGLWEQSNIIMKFVIVKTGNLITAVMSSSGGVVVGSSSSSSSSEVRLKLIKRMFDGDTDQKTSMMLINGYKF